MSGNTGSLTEKDTNRTPENGTKKNTAARSLTIRLTVTALLMAVNIAFSSFSIPVPGGHMYLNDAVICLAAILLNPLEAFVVGGIGAFLGDFFFYPTPMFVSLVVHGLQAVVISVFAHKVLKHKPVLASVIGVAIGVVINVVGYTIGRAFIYSNPETAMLKLPFQILQAVAGSAIGTFICWKCGIRKLFRRMTEV